MLLSGSVVLAAITACYSGPTLDQGYYGLAGAADGGGEGGGVAASGCKPDLPTIQKTIFAPTCMQAGCHNATDHAAGLDLSVTDLGSELIGQASACLGYDIVSPGAPDRSSMYLKLAATPPCGGRMPMGQPDLPLDDKECIRQWIASLTTASVDAGVDAAGCGDTQTSPTNCGMCGKACPTSAACVAGACKCPATQSTICSGACVDTQTDPKNCKTCGTLCPSTAPYCVAGACSSTCALTTCPGGLCVDTSTSFSNCGVGTAGCGHSCLTGQTCTAGVCACPSGQIVCGSTCIANTTTNNCGTCGNVCAPGETCTGGKCTCGSSSVSFGTSVQPIFTKSCATAGCHVKGAGTNVQNLDLSTGDAYANLVNKLAAECSDGRLRVKPLDPSTSYLIEKLTNVNLCGAGTQMPKKGISLASTDIITISNWICEGAPNN